MLSAHVLRIPKRPRKECIRGYPSRVRGEGRGFGYELEGFLFGDSSFLLQVILVACDHNGNFVADNIPQLPHPLPNFDERLVVSNIVHKKGAICAGQSNPSLARVIGCLQETTEAETGVTVVNWAEGVEAFLSSRVPN